MLNDILNEIYNEYKSVIEENSSMWKSEFCCSKKEAIRRDAEDEILLKHFAELLQDIRKDFIKLHSKEATYAV